MGHVFWVESKRTACYREACVSEYCSVCMTMGMESVQEEKQKAGANRHTMPQFEFLTRDASLRISLRVLNSTELLKVYKPVRQLSSSSDTSIFLCSLCAHALAWSCRDRFTGAAPSVCNSLPCKVRSSDRLVSFKSSLKSHLFKLS